MNISRIQNLTKAQFISDYLLTKSPVIVTDAMKDWDLKKFNPEYLKKEFGDCDVQVYDDLFNMKTIESLTTYLERNFGKEEITGVCEYIRWYTQFKDIDFYWSDEVFSKLKSYWGHPYFFPNDSFVVPFCEKDSQKNANEVSFPYKGLFISGKGSGTRLHKDPLHSSAILCQFYGEKKVLLFHPDKENVLMKDGAFIDLKNIDHAKFSNYSGTNPDYEDILQPGEVILFPAGWFHDVTCLSDSVSITWNFIHGLEVEGVCHHLSKHPEDDQLEVLRFFLNDKISLNAGANEIISFLKNHLQLKEVVKEA
jgi:hypothetical protein